MTQTKKQTKQTKSQSSSKSTTQKTSLEDRLKEQEKLMTAMLTKIERIDKQLKRELVFRWVRYGLILFLVITGTLYLTPYIVRFYESYLEITQQFQDININPFKDLFN